MMLNRIFSQELKIKLLKFLRTQKKKKNSIILYTIVETKLAKYIAQKCEKKNTMFQYYGEFNIKLLKTSEPESNTYT